MMWVFEKYRLDGKDRVRDVGLVKKVGFKMKV
jgi:hypothetical protein